MELVVFAQAILNGLLPRSVKIQFKKHQCYNNNWAVIVDHWSFQQHCKQSKGEDFSVSNAILVLYLKFFPVGLILHFGRILGFYVLNRSDFSFLIGVPVFL